MIQKIKAIIQTNQLFNKGERLLIGVSGGPDSLFLLLIMHALASDFQWKLAVAHVNHGLRGQEACEEEAFVQQWATRLELPFFHQRVDIRELGQIRKLGEEEAGRYARYAFFQKSAVEFQATAVVLGHQADDQVENFFLRLLRGSGSVGLSAIPYSRSLTDSLRVVRPLLSVSHSEIISWLEERQIIYCIDPTNNTNAYRRNQIRNLLIPQLREIAPAFEQHVLHTQDMLATDEAYLQTEMEKAVAEIPRDPFGLCSMSVANYLNLPQVLRSRWLRQQFFLLKRGEENLQYQHHQEIERKIASKIGYWQYSLPGKVIFLLSCGKMFLLQQDDATANLDLEFRLPVAEQWPCRIALENCGCNLALDVLPGEMRKQAGVMDELALNQTFHLRNWRKGDRIALSNGGHKSVADLLQEKVIPLPWRARYPLFLLQDTIVFIPGVYTAMSLQPKSTEKPVYRILLQLT